ncbi:cysteine proteinase [Mollisia scopiformis]|uniref:Ubiquitin carboxyl-terminal hydrolase n=1 Tax=Mollisia scopiformis TaxID=149040 RepID=A0A194XUJ0_MOLSC|nr:cysteine proteinase [Mollisia scopiformis]KUJ23985.1 cysteine proteinase [Mollisia scopiformis]
MSGLFSKFKGTSGTTSPGVSSPSHKNKKDAEPEPEITPLVKMLQNAGPIRNDGSDKFFGLENFGNTCYCNSIVQALYYSVPFREHVVRYPPHSPLDTPNGYPKIVTPIRAPIQNGGAVSPAKPKGITAAEAMKRRAAINAGQPVPASPGQRPEDKPDSPEYKKKHAMLAGPILELTYENASSYGMEESTFTALKDIFMALIANPSRTGVLSPQRFLEIFKRDNEMFRTSMHQDAHEFYGLVLNAVISNVEANAQRIRELGPPKTDDSLAQSMKAAVTSAAHAMGLNSGTQSPGTGWVHEIFEGVLTSETKCLTCETASQRDETFLDLSIDLDQHSSVTSCLRKFSAEEMLCERNKFHCDNCGGLQEAEKRMKIKRLPKILALHLKRFKYTEDMTRLQKLFHRVVYPYHLRMFNTTDDAEDPDRLYELYAVVVHIGGNAYHGHYISVIKTQDRGWLLFDDEMVEPVDKHYVRNFFGDKPGMACAYVLFYQETTVEAMRKEQEAEGLAEVALASQEADIALGHPQPNGTHPSSVSKAVSIPNTPVDENGEFVSLDHAVTSPVPQAPHPALRHSTTLPPTSTTSTTPAVPILDINKMRSKKDEEREKKENKEAEKARKAAEKAAEKERIKAEEKRRKDLEYKRKEYQKTQAEEVKAALAASKASAAEEEERRKREAGASGGPSSDTSKEKENGHEKTFGLSGLSRSHKGSKSMSRKSFGFLGGSGKNGTSSEKGSPSMSSVTPSTSQTTTTTGTTDDTAVEGVGELASSSSIQTPEKHSKTTKDRFSFSGLGRKKSNLMNS